MKKEIGVIVLILLLFIPFAISESVVQVTQPAQPEQKSGIFSSIWGIVSSPLFLGALAILIFFAILGTIAFFVIRWIIQYLKDRSDIFWQLKRDRIKLAKIQKRYPAKHFWKVQKNTPIRLVRKENGKMTISMPVAYYRGDYTTHEGNIALAINLNGKNKWFFFPQTDLLIIPNKASFTMKEKDAEGKSKEITIKNLPQAKDIIQFNENDILIFAESISNMGVFFMPVLKAENGSIINFSLPVYQSLRDVVLGDYLYEQTDEFTKVAKKSIDLNPNLRYSIKSGDNSQAVDIPQGNTQQ